MTVPSRHLAACALAACLAATGAGAQANACTDAIPPSAMRRVLVSLSAEPLDSAARRSEQTVQLFAQSAAEQLRRLLGSSPQQVPDATTRLTWRQIDDGVRIVLRRAGTAEVRSRRPDGQAPDDAAGFALVARAARFAVDSAGPYFWDESVPGDSLAFDLGLVHPIVTPDSAWMPPTRRILHPAFTLPVPTTSPVRPIALRPPQYPMSAQEGSAIGTVVMEFVVDSSGRVDPTSIRDQWPADRRRPDGALGQHYRAFVSAVRRALVDARFEPARMGGCPVRQLVQQPFQFDLRR
jgi:hypothetical protein